MGSINKVFLIGNLGADPEIRYTQNGGSVCNFRIATTEVWSDKSGQRQEHTEWHRIVVWGKSAEHCKEFLRKGRPVHVEGRLRSRDWEDKEGQKRTTVEIIADRVTFLGGGRGEDAAVGSGEGRSYSGGSAGGGASSGGGGGNFAPMNSEPPPLGDDDIPF